LGKAYGIKCGASYGINLDQNINIRGHQTTSIARYQYSSQSHNVAQCAPSSPVHKFSTSIHWTLGLEKRGVHDKHDATERRVSISSWIILLCVMTGIWSTHYSYWLRMQYRSHIVLNHMILEHSGTTKCAVGGGSYYI
jgi:hypothetical protein